METKKLYTVPEVAEILGVHETKVHQLRNAGLLPFMKLGRFKLRAEALDRFLASMEGMDVDEIISEEEK